MLGDFGDWRVLLAPPSHSMVSLSHHAVKAATSLTVSHCLKRSNTSRYADGCHCPVSAPVDLLEINYCVMMIHCWILTNLKSDSNQRGKTDPTVYNRWYAYDWKYIKACDQAAIQYFIQYLFIFLCCGYFLCTVREMITSSPAEFIRLLTSKELNSRYGSFILTRDNINHKFWKNTLHKSYKLQVTEWKK